MVYKKYTQQQLREMWDTKQYPSGVVGIGEYKNGKLHLIHDKKPKFMREPKVKKVREKKERKANMYKAGSDAAKQRAKKASETRARRKQEKMMDPSLVNTLLGL